MKEGQVCIPNFDNLTPHIIGLHFVVHVLTKPNAIGYPNLSLIISMNLLLALKIKISISSLKNDQIKT